MHAILTVGSTEFTALVEVALSLPVLHALIANGYTSFTLQSGTSQLPSVPPVLGLEVQVNKYMADIDSHIAAADLIISHAGAGSILAALRGPSIPTGQAINPRRKLVIVPNSGLMDDHQSQLARALSEQRDTSEHGNLGEMATVCQAESRSLADAIGQAKAVPVVQDGQKKEFAKLLDGLMGFSD